MNLTKILSSTLLVTTSALGISLITLSSIARADSTIPPGYTRSKTPMNGKHCYLRGSHLSYYCYNEKLEASVVEKAGMKEEAAMVKENSMMKKDDSMMKKEDSMMKK
jgi:hypothetical protein